MRRTPSATRAARAVAIPLVLLLLGAAPATTIAEEKISGYAEWRRGDLLIVDGQAIRTHSGTRFKGRGIATLDSIELGYEVEARGDRQSDGVVLAREIEAKPNGDAMFESDVLEATNQIERIWVDEGRMFEPGEDGSEETIGRVLTSGRTVDRVRALTRRLTPPYIDFDRQVRVYVVDTEEWNAAAMGNGAIWVYSGLADAMSDEELAIVLGHELAHFTHEHSRRGAKSGLWQGIAGLGAILAAEILDSDVARGVATVGTAIGLTVWGNGYSRDLEDQADRVGLRYVHEAGMDVGAGPRLWARFRERYGEPDRITNFFLGSHSRPSDRIANIGREIEVNYPSRSAAAAAALADLREHPPAAPTVRPEGIVEEEPNEWVRQVEDQLAAMNDRLGDRFAAIGDPLIELMESEGSSVYDFRLDAGTGYIIAGVCDDDCDDLDLALYAPDGEEIAVDFELDAFPILDVVTRVGGAWGVEVSMPGCATDSCVFGVAIWARR